MAEPTASLQDLIDAIEVPDEVDRDWLMAFFDSVGVSPGTYLAEVDEDLFLHASGQLSGELEMRPGGWRVKWSGQAIKTVLTTVLIGGAMFAAGMDEIPKEIVVAVLPLIVDIEKVRLSNRDKELLVRLRTSTIGLQGLALNPQVIYNRLDATTRSRLNYDDFTAFLEHLVEAGEADDAGYGDVRLRPAGKPQWIRVTWS
jgi:hypothetical protein